MPLDHRQMVVGVGQCQERIDRMKLRFEHYAVRPFSFPMYAAGHALAAGIQFPFVAVIGVSAQHSTPPPGGFHGARDNSHRPFDFRPGGPSNTSFHGFTFRNARGWVPGTRGYGTGSLSGKFFRASWRTRPDTDTVP